MTDLRALLGDRYDDVMQTACGCDGTRTPHCYACSDSTWDHECPDPVPCEHRAAARILARVMPDLLAAAWDEGRQRCVDDMDALFDDRSAPMTPNPYRAPLPTPDALQATGDARSPRDALGDTPARDRAATGIVSAAHYGRMDA